MDFKVTMSGVEDDVTPGGCWMNVSDGKTAYAIRNNEGSLLFPCHVLSPGTHVQGVKLDNKRMRLLVPDKKGKIRGERFRIDSMTDVSTE